MVARRHVAAGVTTETGGAWIRHPSTTTAHRNGWVVLTRTPTRTNMTKKKQKRTTTLAIAATLMGVDRATLRRWCMSGAPHDKVACPPMRSGFLFYVDVQELRAWRATKPEGNRTAFINYAAVDGDA